MSTTPEAQREQFEAWEFFPKMNPAAQEYAWKGWQAACAQASAQPPKLSIQSLWPFKDGGIDPRSELAKKPAQPVTALTDERIDALAENTIDWVGDGSSEQSLRRFARAVETELWLLKHIARSVPEVPAAPYSALLDSSGKWWVPYRPHQAVPAAGVAREQSPTANGGWRPTRQEGHKVYLTTRQILHASQWAAPEGFDADDMDTEWVIGWTDGNVANEDGDSVEPGMVMWLADYPEEGCLPLDCEEESGQQGRAQAAEAAGSDIAKSADLHQIANWPAGSDVTKAALKVIKDRDDFGWSREADDAIDALRVALSKNSAARKGGEAGDVKA